jgi:long-chain acyl-CoA synthetase
MIDTPLCPAIGERVSRRCTTPFPKGDESTTRLAKRYAKVIFQVCKEKQYVVLCGVPAPIAQAITLGAWMVGLPVAYLNPAIPTAHLSEVLSLLGKSLTLGTPDCLSALENKEDWLSPDPDGKGDNNLFDRFQSSPNGESIVPYEWNDDECAVVIFTSGSTGRPKGVCHSLGNIIRSAEHFIGHYSIDSNDRLLNLAPMYALSGVLTYMVTLVSECKLVESHKAPTLEDVLNILRNEKPTIFICGPIFIRQITILADKLDEELKSLRVLLSTGAKLDRGTRVRLWEKKRIPVLDCYGSSEVAFAIGEPMNHYQPEMDIIGKPYGDITLEIVEVEGMSDPESGLGQIRIFSPNIFLGYLGKPRYHLNYFDSGDLGIRDEAGNIILKGRLGHGVKTSNTLWIFPQALEQLLVNRSDIADAYVRSGYDQYDRGVLHAKVVPANPETVDEDWLATLSQDIEDQLGPEYKAADIEIARTIPRTVLGKIIKGSC